MTMTPNVESFAAYMSMTGLSEGTTKDYIGMFGNITRMAGGDLRGIFTDGSKLVTVLDEIKRTKAPKTANKYYGIINKFINFLLTEPAYDGKQFGSESDLTKTNRRVNTCLAGLKRSIKHHEALLKSKISDCLLDKASVNKFRKMLCDETDKAYDKYEDQEKVDWSITRPIRDALMIEIECQNAGRSGLCSSLLLSEVNNRKIIDGKTEIKVCRHKTMSTHGPATIILDEYGSNLLEMYLVLRSKTIGSRIILEGLEDEPFFIEKTGNKMSNPGQTMARLWESYGLPGRFLPTNIRKTTSTHVQRTLPPLEANEVANYMSHLPSTARKFYLSAQETDANQRAGKIIRESWRINEDEASGSGVHVSEQGRRVTAKLERGIKRKIPLEDEDEDGDEDENEDEEWVPCTEEKSKPKKQRKVLTDEDSAKMRQMCKEEFIINRKKGRPLKYHEIITKVYNKMKPPVSKKRFGDKARHGGMKKFY
ncbi:uncharacterized protein LOC135157173 [Lytechinus pictus]|uniref:uncharacterized protein LOC135157173 n=1 Tax=Lytechinus pictus TaxID=7653 RepID=UPI0030B9C575